MVPKLHNKGASFKGAATYLLHDKDRAESSDRVAWTETRNLSIADPAVAWRIMAATAMDQERLKSMAGVKASGRKSAQHVLHMTLSWHPEETPDRAEMMRAVDGALEAIGAPDRQVLVVAHNDEAHPHVHVLINRVSPEDGRHLSSSNERRNLSHWAEAYEKERGQVYCENRVVNNAMRAQGDYVRGTKNMSRHIFEQQRTAAANDNRYVEGMRAGQRAKDGSLALADREQAKRHAGAWKELERRYQVQKAMIGTEARQKVMQAQREIVSAHKPKLAALLRQQRSEMKTFEALEKSLFGRARNVLDAVALVKRTRGEESGSLIAQGFQVLANAGARRTALEKAHAKAQNVLRAEQKALIQEKRSEVRAETRQALSMARSAFQAERSNLIQRQSVDKAELRSEWRDRGREREKAWAAFGRYSELRAQPKDDFTRARKGGGKGVDTESAYRASLLVRQARIAMRHEGEQGAKDADRFSKRDSNDQS